MATLRVGDPITGFVESTNNFAPMGAHLAGWEAALASGWDLLPPDSFPGGIELNRDFIAIHPRLRWADYPIAHAPNVTYARFVCPELPKYYDFGENPVSSNPKPSGDLACNRPRNTSLRRLTQLSAGRAIAGYIAVRLGELLPFSGGVVRL